MKKLRLPIIKKPLPEARSLSMNDYLEFVIMNLKYFLNLKAYRAWKKKEWVRTPFVLRK